MISGLGETLDCKDKAQCLEMLVKIKLKYVTLANDNKDYLTLSKCIYFISPNKIRPNKN